MTTLVVTYKLEPKDRALLEANIGGVAKVIYLTDLDEPSRRAALRGATVVLARNTGKELGPAEPALLADARLIQFINAGIDFVPLKDLPPGVPVASNGGAYAEPMAEHALAMALAAAKRLIVEHTALTRCEFNQGKLNRTLAGRVCGILGFGGIGVATARLMRAVGMRIHAINQRGASEEPADWIATPDHLDELLSASDVLVIATPLTPGTLGMIAARELTLMKDDAILVNLARGEIVDENALFAHLESHPRFYACIDAWWVEPVRHGAFRMDRPFMSLPNVVGSPHNSASVPGTGITGLQRATANIRRALAGETPLYLVGPQDRMM